MAETEQYAYTVADSVLGEASLMPFLPITLKLGSRSVEMSGLLDTGSSVNVLPYQVGLHLGADWDAQANLIELGGNLARFEAHGLIVMAQVGKFDPVRLIFAWTKTDEIPLILGQTNFFMEFDICFHRSRLAFEVSPKP